MKMIANGTVPRSTRREWKLENLSNFKHSPGTTRTSQLMFAGSEMG